MSTAKVQSRGQVTVPQDIRDACGVEAGTELVFRRTSQVTFECQVLPLRPSLDKVATKYEVDGVAPDLASLREQLPTT